MKPPRARNLKAAAGTENRICVGARRNHLPSERDNRPDVLLPWAVHLALQVEIQLEAERHSSTSIDRAAAQDTRARPTGPYFLASQSE
jgi:hypothetical protein